MHSIMRASLRTLRCCLASSHRQVFREGVRARFPPIAKEKTPGLRKAVVFRGGKRPLNPQVTFSNDNEITNGRKRNEI